MAVVVYLKNGKKGPERWLVRDTSRDFSTQYGAIPQEHLVPGTYDLGSYNFVIVKADFRDLYLGMKRRAQIITRKDIGFIIGYCALGKDSRVVESGAGSGGATLLLANVCKEVHSFEIEEKNIEVVEKNIKTLGITNVTVTKHDIYTTPIPVKDADMVLLDLPEPWQALKNIDVRVGGYIVAYTPTILQAQQFVQELSDNMWHERTVEVIDRDWKVAGRAVRPTNGAIGHTAFLTFVRRLV